MSKLMLFLVGSVAMGPFLMVGGFILALLGLLPSGLGQAVQGLLTGVLFLLRYSLLPLVMLYGGVQLFRLTPTPVQKARVPVWVLLGSAMVTGTLACLLFLSPNAFMFALLALSGLLALGAFARYLVVLCEHLRVEGSPLLGLGLALAPVLLLPGSILAGASALVMLSGLIGLAGFVLLIKKLRELVRTLEQPR